MKQRWCKVWLLERISVHDEYWEVEDEDGNTGIAMYSLGEMVSETLEID